MTARGIVCCAAGIALGYCWLILDDWQRSFRERQAPGIVLRTLCSCVGDAASRRT